MSHQVTSIHPEIVAALLFINQESTFSGFNRCMGLSSNHGVLPLQAWDTATKGGPSEEAPKFFSGGEG